MRLAEALFWQRAAMITTTVMGTALAVLTVDSLGAIREGGSHVPPFTVINRDIRYERDAARGIEVPVLGEMNPLFGKMVDEAAATALIDKGKLVIQSRACIGCHTFFGNGGYYAPDLTKAWLDPDWRTWQTLTSADSREEAMVRFLRDPVKYRTWTRTMPNLGLDEEEARAVVAYLKWMASVDTKGFPANFGHIGTRP
jgi:nitric oxide reductase subunit C